MRHLLVFALLAAPVFAADQELVRLVPPEMKVVAGLQVERARTSPFGQFLLSQIPEGDADFRKFVETTAFDPRRDLREILVASAGTPEARKHGLVLARGIFNGAQIFAAVPGAGKQVTTYAGVPVLSSKGGSEWLAFVDGSIAVAGGQALVKAALDRRKQASATATPLAAKIESLSLEYDAWMVSTAPVGRLAGIAPDRRLGNAMQSEAMEAIEQTSGGVKFGTLVQVSGEAITKTAKDATALADVIRFLAGMLQMNREKPGAEQFVSLLDTLEVSAQGTAVQVRMSIPEAQLEQLMKPRRKMHSARARQ